jgi:hypothetical protein
MARTFPNALRLGKWLHGRSRVTYPIDLLPLPVRMTLNAHVSARGYVGNVSGKSPKAASLIRLCMDKWAGPSI